MKAVNIHEAKTHFSSLLAAIEKRGEEILICRNGKPVADLVPHRNRDRMNPHPVMKKIRIAYDVTEPLTADEWPEASR